MSRSEAVMVHGKLPGWDRLVVAVAAIVGLAGAGASLHARATMADVESRVAVLESQRKDDVARLIRIEDKLDRLLMETGGRR